MPISSNLPLNRSRFDYLIDLSFQSPNWVLRDFPILPRSRLKPLESRLRFLFGTFGYQKSSIRPYSLENQQEHIMGCHCWSMSSRSSRPISLGRYWSWGSWPDIWILIQSHWFSAFTNQKPLKTPNPTILYPVISTLHYHWFSSPWMIKPTRSNSFCISMPRQYPKIHDLWLKWNPLKCEASLSQSSHSMLHIICRLLFYALAMSHWNLMTIPLFWTKIESSRQVQINVGLWRSHLRNSIVKSWYCSLF